MMIQRPLKIWENHTIHAFPNRYEVASAVKIKTFYGGLNIVLFQQGIQVRH